MRKVTIEKLREMIADMPEYAEVWIGSSVVASPGNEEDRVPVADRSVRGVELQRSGSNGPRLILT
ncbi:hypothetical protein CMI37_22625 [Candidatus Pacearchaeota archaeon]|nr:hypothetical protein [Candidatus Pacearchaeota archaeon]